VWIFCDWRHKWRTFRPTWLTSPGPGPKPLDGSISLKFLLETRLQSGSFETLDDLLGFRVQKLWFEVIKMFDWYWFILDHNFWTRNARKSIKGSKNSDLSLVSNENFSEILRSSSWALGQVRCAEITLKLLHLWRYDVTHKKSATSNQKIFFECGLDDLPNLLRIHLSAWTAL